MTYEQTKKNLKELLSIKRLLRIKERQIAEERAQISVAAVDYSRERISTCDPLPQQQRFVEHMERLESDYLKLFDRMCSIEDELARHLCDLTELEQSIVLDHYMHGKSWKKLQRDYNYSPAQMYRIESRALHKISKDDSR